MSKMRRSIPRRYRHYPYLILLICLLIYLINTHQSLQFSIEDVINTSDNNELDLFDDDGMLLACPRGIRFNIANRHYLAIFVGPKLVPFLWKNFHALLCTGVDVYVMLDEVFDTNSSTRADIFPARTNRSLRSYTHRFLYVPDQELTKYGVSYMTKFPSVKYTAWERTIVWLYHRQHLTTVWVMDYRLQWLHVQNLTDFFDFFASDTHDILCANLVPTNSEFWKQWPKKESDIFPKSYWRGIFSPFARWSRRLLLHHYQYMQLMHQDRLGYAIDRDFRFQEFLMGTIANIENLSIALYSQEYPGIHIQLSDNNDKDILKLLQRGKHIIYPVTYDSILTKYRTEEKIIM